MITSSITNHETRRALYSHLRSQIANTPLLPVRGVPIPNNCKIYAKAEYLNPSGSHYDREMLRFLERLELDERRIRPWMSEASPGTRMLETTTGNSGASFAWLCRVLGYPPPLIVIPADMPRARRKQIESYGAELKESPAGRYISGIEETFGALYHGGYARNEGLYCPCHWADETEGVAAMRDCAEEVLAEARREQIDIDFFMLALGNGSSARGVAEVVQEHNASGRTRITLIGMEPAESPVVAEYLEDRGLIPKPVDSYHTRDRRPSNDRKHGILGTGPAEQKQVYRNMQKGAKMLNALEHVSTEECKGVQEELMDGALLHVGMSSAGCVAAIRNYIRRHGLRNRTFATIFYDPAWKYLD